MHCLDQTSFLANLRGEYAILSNYIMDARKIDSYVQLQKILCIYVIDKKIILY